MKTDFLKQLETASFPEFVARRTGIPCDHPGCASHLSHPCEGCGRYAAGKRNGPDVDHAKRYIRNLKGDSELIHKALLIAFSNNWSWQQVLTFLVIEQDKLIQAAHPAAGPSSAMQVLTSLVIEKDKLIQAAKQPD